VVDHSEVNRVGVSPLLRGGKFRVMGGIAVVKWSERRVGLGPRKIRATSHAGSRACRYEVVTLALAGRRSWLNEAALN
jgi:hypothetical protein